jgi:hypothetical protein
MPSDLLFAKVDKICADLLKVRVLFFEAVDKILKRNSLPQITM